MIINSSLVHSQICLKKSFFQAVANASIDTVSIRLTFRKKINTLILLNVVLGLITITAVL